jgi:hypothetical protein
MEMISKNVWINSASFKNIFGCDIERSINFEKKIIIIIKNFNSDKTSEFNEIWQIWQKLQCISLKFTKCKTLAL